MKIATATLCSALTFTAGFIAASADGAAQRVSCKQRDDGLGHLAEKYQKPPVAVGVTHRSGPVEVLAIGDGKTWTIIVSSPDGAPCMVAAGEDRRAPPRADTPDGPQG